MRRLLVVFALAGVAAGCSRAGEESAGKRTPVPPPPQAVTVPADLKIAVTVDGVAQPAIDAARLGGQAPDYADDERRAWRLSRLLPAFDRPGAIVEAHGRAGIAVKLQWPAAGGLEPVLFLTRRGGIAVTVVDPAVPFPDYHGQGGRLRRPGDPLPHVSPVLELAVVTAPL